MNESFSLSIRAEVSDSGEIKGVAYTGSVMTVSAWGDVCLDLTGLRIPDVVPVVCDHDTKMSNVISAASIKNDYRQLTVEGALEATEVAQQIRSLASKGMALEMSVGVQPTKHERVEAGQPIGVNGNTIVHDRAFTLISEGDLYEVSVVLVGADRDTFAIVASHGEDNMSQQEVIQAERQRFSALTALGQRYGDVPAVAPMVQASIDSGATVDQLRSELLDIIDQARSADRHQGELHALRQSRPASHAPGQLLERVTEQKLFEATVLRATGHHELIEKAYGPEYAERTDHLRGSRLSDVCRMVCEARGAVTASMSREEMFRAACAPSLQASGTTTLSLPQIFQNALNKSTEMYFADFPSAWDSVCRRKSANDFRQHSGMWLNTGDSLSALAADGELKHMSFSEGALTWSVSTYGKIASITRRDLHNDDLGVMTEIPELMAKQAARSLADGFAEQLIDNSDNYWSAGNKNLLTGASSALGMDSLALAYQMLSEAKDANGRSIDVSGRKYLIVPPSLTYLASTLLRSDTFEPSQTAMDAASVTSAGKGSPFYHRDNTEIIEDPRLSNSDQFSGASDTRWFLSCGSVDAPLLVAFLNGRSTPVIETQDQSFEKLGMQVRSYFDHGFSRGHYQTIIRAEGEA